MNEELKLKVKTQRKLQEILDVNRVQAWRLWNGHSQLTASNKKLIDMVLEAECKTAI